MKIYIIFALIALTAAEWNYQTLEEWSQVHKACDSRYKVSDELIEKAKADKYPPKEVFQVVLCIFRGSGIWSDSEGFSIDRIMLGMNKVADINNLDKAQLRQGLESCNDKNSEGSSALDWAYRVFKCVKDNNNLFEALRQVKFYREVKQE